jgi:hypothetical protein
MVSHGRTPRHQPTTGAGMKGAFCSGSVEESWSAVPEAFHAGAALPPPWEELFGPLRTGSLDDLVIVGQIGQSLDGRIATADEDGIAPAAILKSLAACGFRRIMIEGGAHTVSCFLALGCFDRLHVVVAPLILGAGPPALELIPVERVDQALRPPVQSHRLGDEVLFDCDLSAQRKPIGRAKKST